MDLLNSTPLKDQPAIQEQVPAPVAIAQQEQDQPVSIDPGAPSPLAPTPEVAARRSFKAAMGLGKVVNQDYQSIHDDISSGNEQGLRESASAQLDMQNTLQREQRIREATLQKGHPLTVDDVNQILDPNDPRNKKVNPSSVIEHAYGHAAVNSLEQASQNMGSTFLDDVKENTPVLGQAAKTKGSTLAASMERARTEAENINRDLGKESTLGWIWDTAKTFVQPYDEIKLRGLVDSIYGVGGLGSNLDAQTGRLLTKTQEEQEEFWDSPGWKKLREDNPQLAAQFVGSFLGQTSTDRVLGDLNSVLNIPTALSGVKIATGLGKAVRDLNFLRNGVKQVVEASQAPKATDASITAAAGDLDTAAVKVAVSNVAEDLQGTPNPTERAIDALPAALRSDQRKLYEASPAREIVNRLNESNENLITALQDHERNALKVPAAQEVTSSEVAIKKIIQDQKENTYKGPGNSIIESNGPFRDSRSNSMFIEHKIGTEGGDYAKSWEQMYGIGKLNNIIMKTPKSYVDALQNKIDDLTEAMHSQLDEGLRPIDPLAMDADVNELNRHVNMQNELESLLREKADIERRGPGGFAIKNQGLGFYISYMQPIDMTSKVVRDLLSTTSESRLQPTWLKGWMRWIRTPAETLSQLENQARVVATHGPSKLLELFADASKPIQKLPNKYHEDWNRAISFAQKAIDPATKRPGYFFQNIPEMEEWYQRFAKDGRLPSDPEIEAYFAFKRNVEAERQLRIGHLLSLKNRMGAEQHRIQVLDKTNQPVFSNFVEGVLQKEAPGGEDTVLVTGSKLGDEKLYAANDPRLKIVKGEIEKGDKGWQVMRVIDPDRTDEGSLKTFGKVGDARVRWVVSKKLETKPLSYDNQINRTGGGHFVIDADHYLKKAAMSFDPVSKHWNYSGDRTVAAVPNAAVGRDFAKKLDEVEALLEAGKEKEAKALHAQHQLPMDFDEVKSWYKDSHDPMGNRVPARLSYGNGFKVVPANKLSIDMDNSLKEKYGNAFKDRTKQGSDMRQAVVEFTGQRDAYETYSIEDKGSRANPLYAYEPAQKIDPIPTYNRALARIINSSYIDHYKINAVEHWMAQAKHLLDGKPADFEHSPFYYFSDPKWLKSADPIEVSQLMAAKYNIDQFVGTPSKIDAHLNAIANKLAESVYTNVSHTAGNLITNAWDLHYVRNPIAFIRAVTFHAKMGLFSIPQFFMQFMTASNVLAIGGGKHFFPTMVGTYLHQLSRVNSAPEILSHLDAMASKMGWRPGEWTEFNKLMKDTGFGNIGGEHAFKDAPWSAKVIKHLGNDILDWGELPFREGAKNTRILSMAMAYKEFREGPVEGKGIIGALKGGPNTISRRGSQFGALSEEDRTAILQRAADLDHNMSRAANSMLHTGIMAPIGQFTAYSLRLMELFTGKRLTWQEKARLFGVSSVLYGVPIGGVGLYGYPIGDYLREKAKDAGYNPGENFIPTVIGEGALSALTGVIFGTNVNFSGYGAKGVDPAQEILWSDKPMWNIFGGAAASTVGNLWAETSGLRRVFQSHITGSQDSYPLTANDVFGWTREVTSVNALLRGAIALNTGKWMSKNNIVLQDNVSATKAILETFSGRLDQKVADVTININAQTAQKATEKWVEHEYPIEIRAAIQSVNSGDTDAANKHFERAKWIMDVAGDYPIQKRAELQRLSVQNDLDLVTRLNFDFALKNPPASKATARQQSLQDQIKLDEQRGIK